eukprot:TRINITY_DN3224_c0_g1_i4.p2 TRINITY_DN3224_c0_g1~~TRINITY_DN3224_c0_g1_i4.p2  ORF type:complete len:191 (-),score=-15.68 TRINITY_DN3224_c0_g1_i4:692-1264(-)
MVKINTIKYIELFQIKYYFLKKLRLKTQKDTLFARIQYLNNVIISQNNCIMLYQIQNQNNQLDQELVEHIIIHHFVQLQNLNIHGFFLLFECNYGIYTDFVFYPNIALKFLSLNVVHISIQCFAQKRDNNINNTNNQIKMHFQFYFCFFHLQCVSTIILIDVVRYSLKIKLQQREYCKVFKLFSYQIQVY